MALKYRQELEQLIGGLRRFANSYPTEMCPFCAQSKVQYKARHPANCPMGIIVDHKYHDMLEEEQDGGQAVHDDLQGRPV